MAGTDSKVAGLPSFPGKGASGKPGKLGAGGRVQSGAMPVGGVAPSTRPGGNKTVTGGK